MVLVYSQLTDSTALLIGGAVMGVFVNGMLGGYGARLSELYPTQAGGTAENVLFKLGRGVGGFGPLAVGALVSPRAPGRDAGITGRNPAFAAVEPAIWRNCGGDRKVTSTIRV